MPRLRLSLSGRTCDQQTCCFRAFHGWILHLLCRLSKEHLARHRLMQSLEAEVCLVILSWVLSGSRNRRKSSGVCYAVGPRAVAQPAEPSGGWSNREQREMLRERKKIVKRTEGKYFLKIQVNIEEAVVKSVGLHRQSCSSEAARPVEIVSLMCSQLSEGRVAVGWYTGIPESELGIELQSAHRTPSLSSVRCCGAWMKAAGRADSGQDGSNIPVVHVTEWRRGGTEQVCSCAPCSVYYC